MARMHSGARGRSRSKKPLSRGKPTWIRYKPKEVELLIVKLAKEGKTSSEIGIILRDSYGIPDTRQVTERKISQILDDKKLLPELPEDMTALIRKVIFLKKHLIANKHDMSALRGLKLTESKIRRLSKYYKKIGRIPVMWKYVAEEAERYVK